MADAGAAVARIKLPNQSEIDIQSKIRVLLLDDEPKFLRSTKEFLEQEGCTVDAVRYPAEAAHLLERENYQMVVADLNFDPPHISGERFITDNIQLMNKAKVIAVTGQALSAYKIKRELAKLGVEFIHKDEDVITDRLTNIACEKAEEQRQYITNFLQSAVGTITTEPGIEATATAELTAAEAQPLFSKRPAAATEYLLKNLEFILTSYLRSRKQPDCQAISYGDCILSPNELARHIEDGTEIGLAHLDMLIREFKSSLRFD